MKLSLAWKRGPRRGLKSWLYGIVAAGGAVAVVGAVFVFSFLFAMRIELRSTQVEVPELAGLTLEAAERAARPLDLTLKVVDEHNDPRVASGRVLEQVPQPGSSVRRGRTVKLVLSLGGKVLEVPDLIGHAARAVEIELRRQGFVAGDEAHLRSWDMEAGKVLAQVPPPSVTGVPNARVHRLVSDGPPDLAWVMPNLVGMNRLEVERWIAASGFRRGSVRSISAMGRPAGTVVAQLPLAGYPIRSKDIVELAVAQ